MHHQVYGAGPVRIAIEQPAEPVEHLGLGGLVEKVLGPDGARDAGGALLLASADIGLGERNLRGQSVGHGAAKPFDQRRAVGLFLG